MPTSRTDRASKGGARRTQSSGGPKASSVPGGPISRKGVTVTLAHEVFRPDPDVEPAPSLERRFELSEQVGEGGMGAVFAARDSKLGRTVAIKVLAGEHQRDGKLRSRFLVEAQVGAQLEHPNIVPLYSFELTATGAPAIAMQLVEGQTMAAYVKECEAALTRDAKSEDFSLKRRVERLLPVCDAIDYAHGRGVIHRDLKPENVMLGHHNEVFVMDWGIARVTLKLIADASAAATDAVIAAPLATLDLSARGFSTDAARKLAGALPLDRAPAFAEGAAGVAEGETVRSPDTGGSVLRATQVGEVIGTMQYMSPEQALGKVAELDESTDQFSLGLMLYELATLRSARAQNSVPDLYVAAMAGTFESLVDWRGRPLDGGLSAIIQRATTIDPRRRYPSVRDFADDLGRYLRDEELDVLPDGFALKVARRIRERPVVAVSLLFALIAVAASIVGASLRREAVAAQKAEHRLGAIAQVTAAVGRRAHAVDKRFDAIASLVERIGGRAQDRLELVRPKPVPYLRSSEMDTGGPPDTRFFDRYEARVSLMQPMFVFPARQTTPQLEAMALQLVGMNESLREALLQSVSEPLARAPRAEQDAAFWGGDVPLFRIGVAFENGLLVQLPARSGLSADYDVRTRPWYKELVGTHGTRWGRPFRDSTGLTTRISCLRPMWRGDQFLGVSLGDLRFEELLRAISMADVEGYRESYLLNEDGLVIVDKEMLTSNERLDDGLLPLHPPAEPALRQAVRDHRASGTFVLDGVLVVFTKMIEPPFYFVAEFDDNRY
jgi:serine/threonine protein kinase